MATSTSGVAPPKRRMDTASLVIRHPKLAGEPNEMDPNKDKFYRARIVQRREITGDLWSIRVRPGADFHFAPGQYATLGVVTPAKHIERPYSIVSSLYESELEFFFELVPRGELTPALHKLQVGDELTVRKTAKGRFTLDAESNVTRKNHLLLCTVTGVAPFVSYIRTLHNDAAQNKFPEGHKLLLLEGASHSREFGYIQELKRFAGEAAWLKYVPTISRPWEDPNWTGEVGRADDIIRKYVHLWGLTPGTTSAYLCGHPKMIEHSREILMRAGWPDDQIKEEIYFVPKERVVAV